MRKPITIRKYHRVAEATEIFVDFERCFVVNMSGTLRPHRNQRCYSDASWYANVTNILYGDKVLSFKVNPGIITCQSGELPASLWQIIVFSGLPAKRHGVTKVRRENRYIECRKGFSEKIREIKIF
jgi:hypothetical protein